ncbi:hypothetical protein QA600_22020 [Natronococcus sp. A-GB1]|uniref:hypothetical protein n=1 Tax=Natronococcus sp. A-GB1 TaxID=3037648 RepID=UPI00241D99DA|nr:hypothetical protein [Natronococcus sp. A-GB1]MDG5761996.1 hypothetical protein [Natronococcus sp. A-GB1]
MPGLAAADAGLSADEVVLQTDGTDANESVWEPPEDDERDADNESDALAGSNDDLGVGVDETDDDPTENESENASGDGLENGDDEPLQIENSEDREEFEELYLEENEDEEEEPAGRSILGGAGSAVSNTLNPADAAEEVWERLTEMFAGAMSFFVEEVFNEALGTPTINNDGAFGILGTPEALEEGEQTPSHKEAGLYDAMATENYVTVYEEVYLGLVMPMAISVMFLLALLMLVAPAITAITRRKVGSILASGVFVVMMIVAVWEFATLMHALSDAAAQLFLPDGEDVLDSGVTTYSGGVATALILYFKGWVGGAALGLIHATRHVLLFVYPAVLPIFFILAYWGGHRRVKQVGSFFIWQWYGLLVMNIPTAILLAFANAIGWQLFPWELLNFLATLGIFALAVLIPFTVSGSFFLIGLSMRGAAVGTASSVVSKYAPSPRPASVFGGERTRSAKERLKRGGERAGAAAANRSKAAAQRAKSSVNSRRPIRTDGGQSANSSSGSSSGGSNSSTTQGAGVTPDQRRKAAQRRQDRARNSKQAERARKQSDHYRK